MAVTPRRSLDVSIGLPLGVTAGRGVTAAVGVLAGVLVAAELGTAVGLGAAVGLEVTLASSVGVAVGIALGVKVGEIGVVQLTIAATPRQATRPAAASAKRRGRRERLLSSMATRGGWATCVTLFAVAFRFRRGDRVPSSGVLPVFGDERCAVRPAAS
jgi:hypothetical protein